ncbi:hypothetical protein HZA56_07770 [Candidatus Poribacteria bacterium]|nr:hypothetical protein [Candidatus Poribacteria bacterium]
MADCGYCGKGIRFGGIHDWDKKYCSEACCSKGKLVRSTYNILPHKLIKEEALKIYNGICPICSGKGPIDVYTSYRIYSIILYTSSKTIEHISCVDCGIKNQKKDAIYSFALGWWGFPWGIFLTPVQLARNIKAIYNSKIPTEPSSQLEQHIKSITRLLQPFTFCPLNSLILHGVIQENFECSHTP